jgi:ribosome-associated protein
MKLTKPAALDAVKLASRVLDDKKAEAIKILDVATLSSITDYLVIATATSEPHLRALRVELEKVLDAAGVRLVGIDSAQLSGWIVLDTFDVMIHLFLAPTREHYGLERLWRDAGEVSLADVLKQPAKAPARKKSPPKPKRTSKRRPAR